MLNSIPQRFQAIIWLALCAAAGVAAALVFDDSCQLDGGMHFLFARWAWSHHELLVGVWSRPLYTFLYSFPALINYPATRFFTVLICLAIGWQTWRLADDSKVGRAPFAIALLWLQPSFFLFCADNMTEPIFALVYVIALRLHHRGHTKSGMAVASLMVLARPEGFFLAILWAIWVGVDRWRNLHTPIHSLKDGIGLLLRAVLESHIYLLAAGAFIWWFAALVVSGDPLFIKHNWPENWAATSAAYGAAGLYAYPTRLPEMTGPLLLFPFLFGLIVLLKTHRLPTITSSFLLLFILHTILRAYGLFGSAGYPRYLITISPAIAIVTLAGWNEISRLFSHTSPLFKTAVAAIIIGLSAYVNFLYADGAEWSRDARAIAKAHSWFKLHPRPISRMIWSEPYSGILFDRDPWENPVFTRNHDHDLKLLRDSPPNTLVVWDEKVGPKWLGLKAGDFEEAGYICLYSKSFTLRGFLLDRPWLGYGGPRSQVIYLLYKQ